MELGYANSKEQFKDIKEKMLSDDPNVPMISKDLPIINWTKTMLDLLHIVIRFRMIPLACVV